jgi:hypothetical protein
MLGMLPQQAGLRIGRCDVNAERALLRIADDAELTQALPGQAERQGIELLCGELQCWHGGPAESRSSQTKRPACSRRVAHHTPKPSCTSSLMRVARALAKR